MTRFRLLILIIACVALASAPRAEAKAVTIKLATLAPDGSAWDKLLREMASDWNKETGKMRPVAHTAGHAVEPEGFGTGTAVSPKYEQAASERSGCAEYGPGRMPPQHC